MRIELTEAENHLLLHLVEQRLRALRPEIRHTTTHDFKTILKDQEKLLEGLAEKLAAFELME